LGGEKAHNTCCQKQQYQEEYSEFDDKCGYLMPHVVVGCG
jgi:hypothetical protein